MIGGPTNKPLNPGAFFNQGVSSYMTKFSIFNLYHPKPCNQVVVHEHQSYEAVYFIETAGP
jgi:hypothetical protein